MLNKLVKDVDGFLVSDGQLPDLKSRIVLPFLFTILYVYLPICSARRLHVVTQSHCCRGRVSMHHFKCTMHISQMYNES